MKDLDFDELDRAVNSLLATKSSSEPPTTAEEVSESDSIVSEPEQVTATDETDFAEAEPATPTLTPETPTEDVKSVEISEETPTAQTAPALATRRTTGRFMDVVHPSSDMRTSPNPASNEPVSRQGLTIAVPTSAPTTMSDVTPVTSQKPAAAPIQTEAIEAVTSDPSPVVNEWPDPLDLQGFTLEEESDAPAYIESPAKSEEVTPDPFDTPLNSPFLADTKVEKRPLGAFSDDTTTQTETPAETLVPQLESDETQTPEEDTSALQEVSETSLLPVELHSAVLAIEADIERTPVVGVTADTAELTSDMTDSIPQINVPTSIAQQYKEEPSTSDQQSGSIYDTDAYHKPLTHPAKKKSGWLWVLWIVILLIVGAGGGAAVYFYVIPLL